MTNDPGVESGYAWLRLAISVVLSTFGGISLWSVVVVLPGGGMVVYTPGLRGIGLVGDD